MFAFSDKKLEEAKAQCLAKVVLLGISEHSAEKVGVYTQAELNLAVDIIRMSMGWLPTGVKGLAREFLAGIDDDSLPAGIEINAEEPKAEVLSAEGVADGSDSH